MTEVKQHTDLSSDKTEDVTLPQAFVLLFSNAITFLQNPFYNLFPKLLEWKIGNKNLKRHFWNSVSLSSAISKYIDQGTNLETSVVQKLIKENPNQKQEILNNMIVLVGASFDTSSHTITAALYFLHIYPEIRKKLTAEI